MKKTSKLIITFAITITIGLSVSAQTLHRSFDPRFRIEIPKDWDIQKNKSLNTKLSISNKSGSNIRISVHQDDAYNGLTSHEIVQSDLTNDLMQLPEYKVHSFKRTYISGREAVCLKSQWRYQSLNLDTTLMSSMYVIIHNDKMYYLTCTTAKSAFSKYESLFKETVSTFVIEEDYHLSKNSTSASAKEKYKSFEDNFAVYFKSDPNVDTEEEMTTYSVTSLKDTAVYRITVFTDNVNITNPTKRKEYEIEYLQECTKHLVGNEISYESTTYKNNNAIILSMQVIAYGENIFFGEKAYVRSIIFFNGNKNFMISVTGRKNSYDRLFDEFLETFEFIY
jgi:hypothetical protein